MKSKDFSPNQKPAAASWVAASAIKQGEIDFVPSADAVARRVYLTYGNQGSQPGHEVQDWLEAEAHLLAERIRARLHVLHDRT